MMRIPQPKTVRNGLLASLPPDTLAEMLPKFRLVTLRLREVIYNPAERIGAVYFPEAGMISMIANLDEGLQAEVGVVGCEGMVGAPLVSAVETSFTEAVVQLPGAAWCMEAGRFRRELEANTPFRTRLLRYNEAFQAQVIQTAACNGRHKLEQRLARWLLMAHDRAEGRELPFTQDLLAMMLGVHRPSVTISAKVLQRAGLIHYANGLINVLDRPGLEASACECYRMVRCRFSALLGQIKF